MKWWNKYHCEYCPRRFWTFKRFLLHTGRHVEDPFWGRKWADH